MLAPDRVREPTAAITPVFVSYRGRGRIDQVGSGVLVNIGDELFLLTAAHVTDFYEQGTLCIPTRDGILPVEGYISTTPAPGVNQRRDGRVDAAYIRVSADISSGLADELRPLDWSDLHLTDNVMEDDVYTFTGYPLSKGRVLGGVASSGIASFTGLAAPAAKYSNLKYDQRYNLVVNFDHKAAVDEDGRKINPAKPKGISGGAVFR